MAQSDSDFRIVRTDIDPKIKLSRSDKGALNLYDDKLTILDVTLPYCDIKGLEIKDRNVRGKLSVFKKGIQFNCIDGRMYFLYKASVSDALKEMKELKEKLEKLIKSIKSANTKDIPSLSFNGANISYREAEALKELENLTKSQFKKMDQLKWDSLNSFSAENNRVTGLCLYGLKLTQLPTSFSKLNELERLFLASNNLTTFPPFLPQFVKLQILDLGSNALTNLPEDIGYLTMLKELRINNNQIVSIPSSIGNLQSLQLLDLSGNKIKILPNSIGRLEGLQVLYLEKNPLSSIPEGLLKLESGGLRIYK